MTAATRARDGELIQDTFVDITNDFGEDVAIQMYFINGDAPIAAVDAPIFE